MFERFTAAARAAVVRAQERARSALRPEIGAADLLAAVLEDTGGVPARVLGSLGMPDLSGVEVPEVVFDAEDAAALGEIGIDLDAVRRRAEESFGAGAFDRRRRQRPGLFGRRTASGHLPLSREAKSSLELALDEAVQERHRYLGTEHLLLGLLGTEEGTALRWLRHVGVSADQAQLRRLVLAEIARAA